MLGLESLAAFLFWTTTVAFLFWFARRFASALQLLRDTTPEVWREVGCPTTIRDVLRDPAKRYVRLIRSGTHRTRCSPRFVAEVRLQRWGISILFVMYAIVTGLMIVAWSTRS